ncbi:6783_t:CDS:2, partial [Racocetra persica]
MPTCSTCGSIRSSEEFILNSSNYKTCNKCRFARSKKKSESASSSNIENNSIEIIPIQEVSHSNIENNSIEIIPIQEVSSSNIKNNFIEIIPIQEVSQYIINTIDDLEDYAELSLVLRIQLDESMISDTDINVKTIAKLIIDEIEEGDGYNWTATTASNLSARHHNVRNAYFACSQSSELERELKDSNQKRTIRYNCGGKVSIKIDIPAAEAKITLKHKILHNKPIEVETPSEVKQEINKHLHLNPVELRQHLRKKFNISNVTSKQIHYWWSYFTQQFYKSDENHIVLAHMFFTKQINNHCTLCFHLDMSNTTFIGFTTCLLDKSDYIEIHCDATYKTSKGRFELYGVVDHYNMDEDNEILTNKCQILESKAVALQRLVDHINVELIANNLQHVESI